MRPIVEAYLRCLDDELRDQPRARRRELVAEIREHIAQAAPATEAELREVLDRLGHPAEIAEEARNRLGVETRRMGLQEIVALILLAIGGLIFPLIGWIIGVALLWGSSAWTYRDKWIGTLLFPGGFALPILVLGGAIGGYYCAGDMNGDEVCAGEPGDLERWLLIGVVVAATLGTIFSVSYLAERARRGAR